MEMSFPCRPGFLHGCVGSLGLPLPSGKPSLFLPLQGLLITAPSGSVPRHLEEEQALLAVALSTLLVKRWVQCTFFCARHAHVQ